ncbi:MAG: hypothetical protein KatS3mg039_1420 [Candidatus Kapaibacterium sp.]|nr:MAG: hypothetical protein KatS3mg039_1420 [Candidatus Kapabacteria bacterium]
MAQKRARIIVYILPQCSSCRRVVELLDTLHDSLQADIRVLDATALTHEASNTTGVCIFPATFINDMLTFYGLFTPEELLLALKSDTRCRP